MRPVVLLLAAWRIWRLANMPRLRSFNTQFGEFEMSNGKFTPGPWVIGAYESGMLAVDGADGTEVTGFIDPEDARLIAAAPCMYSLLAIMAENGDNAARQLIERIGNEKM